MAGIPWPQAGLQLHARDPVAVALRHLEPGDDIDSPVGPLRIRDRTPAGHKFALVAIPKGAAVRKYGHHIGVASHPITPGEHVHSHNLECGLHSTELASDQSMGCKTQPRPRTPTRQLVGEKELPRTFQGYARADGRVGTRNYVVVAGTVNCSSTVVRRIAEICNTEMARRHPHLDGVVAVAHKTGCGMAGSGLDRTYLTRTLDGYLYHANVADGLIISLGCEVNQPDGFIPSSVLAQRGRRAAVLSIQNLGGVQATIEEGVRRVMELMPEAAALKRTPQSISKLILGTNCGGSDAYSGITANPVLGWAGDRLIDAGGASILAETTEIYGAEHLLIDRAVSKEVVAKLRERIAWWGWYTAVLGAAIDNNPSPGNKEGGLTTIFEKSLGAAAKAGSAPLEGVVGYAEQVTGPGLFFMDTPGFDPVSVTGIVAGGANIVAFTTGRGSVLGSKPAPTIKIATHSSLFQRMSADMDFDAGPVLAGETIPDAGRRLFELILKVASGEKTKSEVQGIGDEEFAPWIVGPVL